MISITVMVVLCCAVASSDAAVLRDVRIGEHDDFTRVVFEFDDVTRYSKPALKDKGTLSVVFFESSAPAVLSHRRLQERTRRLDTLKFEPRGSSLATTVTVASRYFKVKTFSLFGPFRVVFDVYWLSAPPPDGAVVEATPLQTGEPVRVNPQPTDRARQGKGPSPVLLKQVNTIKSEPDMPVSQVSSRFDRLQIYLLVVLVALNIITVITLAVLSYTLIRKERITGGGRRMEIDDALSIDDATVVSIDSEIREKLKKYNSIRSEDLHGRRTPA
jgi:hypothetical protein